MNIETWIGRIVWRSYDAARDEEGAIIVFVIFHARDHIHPIGRGCRLRLSMLSEFAQRTVALAAGVQSGSFDLGFLTHSRHPGNRINFRRLGHLREQVFQRSAPPPGPGLWRWYRSGFRRVRALRTANRYR